MRRGGAIGCEVMIAGKARGQPKHDFIDQAVRSVELRQGVLGLKVKIMQGTKIKIGAVEKVMPDFIHIVEPKDDDDVKDPVVVSSKQQEEAPAATPAPAQ